jgi:hypothetical protein
MVGTVELDDSATGRKTPHNVKITCNKIDSGIQPLVGLSGVIAYGRWQLAIWSSTIFRLMTYYSKFERITWEFNKMSLEFGMKHE